MLWVLKRTISMRWFFWAPKTYAKNYGLENIYNFTLNLFVYLDLCCWKSHVAAQIVAWQGLKISNRQKHVKFPSMQRVKIVSDWFLTLGFSLIRSRLQRAWRVNGSWKFFYTIIGIFFTFLSLSQSQFLQIQGRIWFGASYRNWKWANQLWELQILKKKSKN